ncbi:MAG: hypothetical protein Q9177_001664 [Variospora cf. flavescens]
MSRSHSYSSNQSRESRPSRTPNLAVTEASFQGLQLRDSSLPSSYSTSDQYRSRGSYGQDSLNPNYLTAGYDTASFASTSPTGSYLGSQRGVSPFTGLETEPGAYYGTEASAYSRADMSAEDREVARQRRRRLHESRRHAKARVRQARLPTIVEPDASMGTNVGHSIDFLAAPSTSSSYEIGGSSGYPRTTSTSSASYLSGAAGPSSSYHPGYPSSYGVGDVGAHPLYPAPSTHLPSNVPAGRSYNPSRTTSIAPSVSPNLDDPIRVIENPRKPQCWEHGCNGRQFSTFSNLLRHQREKSGTAMKSYCPRCGAEFTRTTARNGHMAHEKCKPRTQK